LSPAVRLPRRELDEADVRGVVIRGSGSSCTAPPRRRCPGGRIRERAEPGKPPKSMEHQQWFDCPTAAGELEEGLARLRRVYRGNQGASLAAPRERLAPATMGVGSARCCDCERSASVTGFTFARGRRNSTALGLHLNLDSATLEPMRATSPPTSVPLRPTRSKGPPEKPEEKPERRPGGRLVWLSGETLQEKTA
jgi:hypothetical protein